MGPFAARQAVFFDFDGVLVDSLPIKTQAFAVLYQDYGPGLVEAVVAYHHRHGGVSRYKKFEHFERNLLFREPTRERLAELGRRFEGMVFEGVIAAPELPGAGALLAKLNEAATPCYVVSGTPEEELCVIIERRGMSRLFRETRGSPAEKRDLLSELCAKHDHDPQRCLMVGDAMGDYEAARAVDMPFVGVVPLGTTSPFPAHTPIVASF